MAGSEKDAKESGSRRSEAPRLDLEQFSSLAEALSQLEPGDRYVDVGKMAMPLSEDGMPMTMATVFWFSMISRAQGLHSAIAREATHSNPDAVFPLIRALAEAVVLVRYVLDHPEYVGLLSSRASELPKNGPKRKSIQALISCRQGRSGNEERLR